MKRNTRIVLIALVLCVVIAGLVLKFKPQSPAPGASNTAAIAKTELLSSDIAQLTPVELSQTIVVNGNINATRQAQVKSQVSGNVLNVTVLAGQSVAAGAVLARIDVQDYQSRAAALQAAVAQAVSQQAIAQRTVDNNKALVDKGFISSNAYDTALQQLDVAKAAVAVANANLNVSKKALEDTTIKAPIAGVVTEKLIAEGDKVSPDMRVFTIVAPGAIEFEGALPAAEATQLKVGQVLWVTPEGVDPIKTTISRINASATSGNRSVSFFASLPTTGAMATVIRPGSFASAKVYLKSSSLPAVPLIAVREDAGRTIVYTLTGNPATIASTPVKTGLRGENEAGEAYIAIEGVAANTTYISRNLGPLRVGSTVVTSAVK